MYMVLEDERMPLQSKAARSFETNPQIIHDVIDAKVISFIQFFEQYVT